MNAKRVIILGLFNASYYDDATINTEFKFFFKKRRKDFDSYDDFQTIKSHISSLSQPPRTIMDNAPIESDLVKALLDDLRHHSESQMNR